MGAFILALALVYPAAFLAGLTQGWIGPSANFLRWPLAALYWVILMTIFFGA